MPGSLRRTTVAALVVVLTAPTAGLVAQPTARRATTISALLTFPGFFHGNPIVVRGELARAGDVVSLLAEDQDRPLRILFRGTAPGDARVEARGVFWDVGRLEADDPRLADYRQAIAGADSREGPEKKMEGWPKPGELLALAVTSFTPAAPPPAPTLRSIVLDPLRYADQRVTVGGQFRARNLYADLPRAPGISRWDFVLRSGDAALWVTGMRPRGKGFNLDPEAKVDTGHWLEVSGAVKRGQGLVWIEAAQIELAKPVAETPEHEAAEPAPSAGPPPEVVFSAPTEGETDVGLSTSVRIQFSRDLDPASIKNQVRASYLGQESFERGEPQPPGLDFTANYQRGNRVLEIRFARALERFRTLKIDLLEGIKATDGTPLKPWTLTFSLGGS